jgi:hypothetical protein
LEVLKYLKEGLGLGKEDAQAKDNYALKWSAENDHLEVLKYLKEGFGLGKEDAQAKDNYALKLSALNGHLEVLQYLKEGYGLGKEAVRELCGPHLFSSLKRKLCRLG